jgi:hypothetical protein
MTMTRRAALFGIAQAGLGLLALAAPGTNSIAQRPAHPINRPGWSGGPLRPGRLNPYTTGGVAGSAPVPGTFTVVSVNRQQNTVKLRDDGGRTADVHVRPDIYDVSTLKPGDEVAVDFLVPDSGETRLSAGSLFKLDPVTP